MPDLPGRGNYERKASRALFNLAAIQQKRLITHFLKFGRMPGQEYWHSVERELSVLLYTLMTPVFENGANRMFSGQPLQNRERAKQWATAKADTMARQITSTSQERFGRAISDKKLDRLTGAYILWLMIHDEGEESLRVRMRSIFGAERAETIAIDAVTAPHNAGELYGFGELQRVEREERARREASGETLEPFEEREPVWEIEDENACPICKGFNGKTRAAWGTDFPEGPPAHPHCRCRLVFSYVPGINIGLSQMAEGQPFGGARP